MKKKNYGGAWPCIWTRRRGSPIMISGFVFWVLKTYPQTLSFRVELTSDPRLIQRRNAAGSQSSIKVMSCIFMIYENNTREEED